MGWWCAEGIIIQGGIWVSAGGIGIIVGAGRAGVNSGAAAFRVIELPLAGRRGAGAGGGRSGSVAASAESSGGRGGGAGIGAAVLRFLGEEVAIQSSGGIGGGGIGISFFGGGLTSSVAWSISQE